MKENNKYPFSKEDLEKVSNIIENNISILLENDNYCIQEDKISNLHEIICSKLKNTGLEKQFLEYNDLLFDHKTYELTLIYNIGILNGIELTNLKNKIKFNSEQYLSKAFIDLYKYLNKEQLTFLEELKIFIENRLYSQEEFIKINKNLSFYTTSSLYSQESINNILEVFKKITNDYNIK